jgi:protein-S-isoprenylcysteine O-methyltransferase Ste14
MTRIGALLYGVLCYAVFLGVFLYGIGFIAGFGTPTALDGAPHGPLGVALAVDLALLAGLALQHSGRARPALKRWWTAIVAERRTYVLVATLLLVFLVLWWQPIGGAVWRAGDGWPRGAVIGLYLFGWALLLCATF